MALLRQPDISWVPKDNNGRHSSTLYGEAREEALGNWHSLRFSVRRCSSHPYHEHAHLSLVSDLLLITYPFEWTSSQCIFPSPRKWLWQLLYSVRGPLVSLETQIWSQGSSLELQKSFQESSFLMHSWYSQPGVRALEGSLARRDGEGT